MKKLTPRFRKWLIHRGRGARIARAAVSEHRSPAAWARRRSEFDKVRQLLPAAKFSYGGYDGHAAFAPPADFSFVTNYEETLAFILDFRKYFFNRQKVKSPDGIMRWFLADFAQIRQLDAGAGLVLAAEIDRYTKSRRTPPTVLDETWYEDTQRFFADAGLFELLKIDPRGIVTKAPEHPRRKTLPLRAGMVKNGVIAREIRDQIEELSGRKFSQRPMAYTAIAEALANIGHAYPSWFRSWPWKPSRRWWSLGFWDPDKNTVGLQLYDQGAGIPATLPRQDYWPRLLRSLEPERKASGLIRAGLEFGRTSTNVPGRGKGMAEMADWIEYSGSGFLRILSGGGEVTYRPGGSVIRRDFDAPFCGTLIEWEIALDA